jgi:hypothetical protein
MSYVADDSTGIVTRSKSKGKQPLKLTEKIQVSDTSCKLSESIEKEVFVSLVPISENSESTYVSSKVDMEESTASTSSGLAEDTGPSSHIDISADVLSSTATTASSSTSGVLPSLMIKTPFTSMTAHEPKLFSGKDSEDATDWLAYFSKYVNFKQMNDTTTIAYFSLLLRDRAGIWFDSLPEEVRSNWGILKQKFTDHFAAHDITRIRDAGSLWSRSQGLNESVSDYVTAMQKLARNLPISPAMLQYAVLNGFRPQIKGQVLLPSCANLDEMLHAAQKAELAFNTVVTGDPILASVVEKFQSQADAYNKGLQELQSQMQLLASVQSSQTSVTQQSGYKQTQFSHPTRQSFQQNKPGNDDYSRNQRQRPPQYQQAGNAGCTHCGGRHSLQCPAQCQQCWKCGKLNHFARVCRSQPNRHRLH